MDYLFEMTKSPATRYRDFQECVSYELDAARAAFPRPQASAHEGFAVLKEEIDELWEIVRQKQSKRDPAAMLKELVQIGAMTQRMAEEVVLGGKVNNDS